MMVTQLLILAIILIASFFAGRFIFWLLFMKDAPALDEQDHYYFPYRKE